MGSGFLTTESSGRLKWSSELHTLFLQAIEELGGPFKAKPRDILEIMDLPGLHINHIKSHLQKFRTHHRIVHGGPGMVEDEKPEIHPPPPKRPRFEFVPNTVPFRGTVVTTGSAYSQPLKGDPLLAQQHGPLSSLATIAIETEAGTAVPPAAKEESNLDTLISNIQHPRIATNLLITGAPRVANDIDGCKDMKLTEQPIHAPQPEQAGGPEHQTSGEETAMYGESGQLGVPERPSSPLSAAGLGLVTALSHPQDKAQGVLKVVVKHVLPHLQIALAEQALAQAKLRNEIDVYMTREKQLAFYMQSTQSLLSAQIMPGQKSTTAVVPQQTEDKSDLHGSANMLLSLLGQIQSQK